MSLKIKTWLFYWIIAFILLVEGLSVFSFFSKTWFLIEDNSEIMNGYWIGSRTFIKCNLENAILFSVLSVCFSFLVLDLVHTIWRRLE